MRTAPNVILESFAAGTPVIGADIGGIPELLRDGGGELFTANDENDLAEHLQRLVDRPILLQYYQVHMPPIRSVNQEMADLLAVYEQVTSGVSAAPYPMVEHLYA